MPQKSGPCNVAPINHSACKCKVVLYTKRGYVIKTNKIGGHICLAVMANEGNTKYSYSDFISVTTKSPSH